METPTNTTEGAETAASSQETTNLEVTPAQDTTTTKTESTTNTTETTPPKEEAWEYNGNREAVPDQFKKYASGFDRYLSKKDQALAEAKKQIAEYESKLKSINPPSKSTDKVEETSLVTQDEIDAIALGDGKTLETVIERAVSKRLEASVGPIAMKQKELEAAETIKSFSDIHPDFQELLDSPAGEFMIDAACRGANLEQIYKTATEAKTYFMQQADTKRKADFEAKKAGSVVGKSITGKSDIVYAENEDQAKRLALELGMKGDNRQVHIKPKTR